MEIAIYRNPVQILQILFISIKILWYGPVFVHYWETSTSE